MSDDVKELLDELVGGISRELVFSREWSVEPRDGYVWDDYWEMYRESDDTFRERIKSALDALKQESNGQ